MFSDMLPAVDFCHETTLSGAKHTNSSLHRYSSEGESWLVYTKKT